MKTERCPTLTICLLLLIILPTTGCFAQKEFRAPAVQGTIYAAEDHTRKPHPKLLVFTGVHNDKVNRKIIAEFLKQGLNAINSLHVLSPLERYSEEELKAFYRDHFFDFVITAELKDKIVNEGVVKQELELTVYDVEKNRKAVIFTGRAYASFTTPEESVRRFFNAVAKELPSIITM